MGTIIKDGRAVIKLKEIGGGQGTSNYNDLSNKPKINGVELNGDKSSEELGIRVGSAFGLPRRFERRADYAFEGWYDNGMDYEYAIKRLTGADSGLRYGGCSSARYDFKGKTYLVRDYDWTFDRLAECLVHVPQSGSRLASIAVCGHIASFTDSEQTDDDKRMLPFAVLDGKNSAGLAINVNVRPIEPDETGIDTGTIKKGKLPPSVFIEIPSELIPRFVLDNFSTVDEAVEFLMGKCIVKFGEALLAGGFLPQFMLSDKDRSVVVGWDYEGTPEVLNAYSRESDVMTNFALRHAGVDVVVNDDGKVWTPADVEQDESKSPIEVNRIQPLAQGLERWNEVVEARLHPDEISPADVALRLNFTKAYNPSSSPRYTEFTDSEHSCGSPASALEPARQSAIAYYNAHKGQRDGNESWHSVHSSVWGLSDDSYDILFQEPEDDGHIQMTGVADFDTSEFATDEDIDNLFE